jgi:hypothetical protein
MLEKLQEAWVQPAAPAPKMEQPLMHVGAPLVQQPS